MNPEELKQKISRAVSENQAVAGYDHCANLLSTHSGIFLNSREAADELVEEKLARYTDETRTQLAITKYGKYWLLNGGYKAYLRESEKRPKGEKHHEDHHHKLASSNDGHDELYHLEEELVEARLKFTKYRIHPFWWNFALSLISFILSLLSIFLVLNRR